MNKSYIYDNDKVIVIDDKGNDKKIDNNDNFKEILVSENVIKELKKKKDKIKKTLLDLKNINKPNKKRYIIKTIASILKYEILLILIFLMFVIWEAMEEYLSFEITAYMIISLMIIIPIVAIRKYFLKYKLEKKDYQEKLSYEIQFYNINKLLSKEKEKLDNLKHNDEVSKRETVYGEVNRVNDIERFKELKRKFQEIKEVSNNSDKLLKSFEKGVLEEKIHNPLIMEMNKGYFNDRNDKKLIKRLDFKEKR